MKRAGSSGAVGPPRLIHLRLYERHARGLRLASTVVVATHERELTTVREEEDLGVPSRQPAEDAISHDDPIRKLGSDLRERQGADTRQQELADELNVRGEFYEGIFGGRRQATWILI